MTDTETLALVWQVFRDAGGWEIGYNLLEWMEDAGVAVPPDLSIRVQRGDQ